MRNFIFSDLHGEENIYQGIMSYLDNISEHEEITLYINGDLIDRGKSSGYILLDVIERIQSNRFPIVYLGGNHELLMYELYEKRKSGLFTNPNDWYQNGGWITDTQLIEKLKTKEKILKVVDFISELPIYQYFEEKIGKRNIFLVHASTPYSIQKNCELKIKSPEEKIWNSLWLRENDPWSPYHYTLGNKEVFSILGHTPNNTQFGYSYKRKEDYLNIDGGFYHKNRQTPLLEIKENYFEILTFHAKKGLVAGNYFTETENVPFTEQELQKVKQLILSKK